MAYDLLSDPVGYASWWRNVPLRIEEIKPADANGLNQIVKIEMRTPLFYALRWKLKGIEARRPYCFAGESSGDLSGRGTWTFKETNGLIHIAFDWEVFFEKPLLQAFSSVLKPVFTWNHNWVMKKWEESFKTEFRKRMAAYDPNR